MIIVRTFDIFLSLSSIPLSLQSFIDSNQYQLSDIVHDENWEKKSTTNKSKSSAIIIQSIFNPIRPKSSIFNHSNKKKKKVRNEIISSQKIKDPKFEKKYDKKMKQTLNATMQILTLFQKHSLFYKKQKNENLKTNRKKQKDLQNLSN